MVTECTQKSFEFQGLGARLVVAQSDGGDIHLRRRGVAAAAAAACVRSNP